MVRAFLERAQSAVSEADVAAGTGLDIGNAKSALYALMRTHRCALAVHDDGTLVYDFGDALVPLGKRSARERVAAFGRLLWRGFSLVYRASLAVVLVAYALAFVALLVAAAVAGTSSRAGKAVGAALRLIAGVFRAIVEIRTHTGITYARVDRHGYRHAGYEPKPPVLGRHKPVENEKSFIASVYDFAFGPERVAPHPLAQQQEVAAFVRRNRGVLTVRDVQALSGMPRRQAEQFFAAFVAEQDGVADVTEDGALYATFEELMRTKSKKHDAPIALYWDEYEAPYALTGNTGGKNLVIILLAAFNLICSIFVMRGAFSSLGDGSLWLGVVPAIIFALFFALPILRTPVVWWKNRQQHRNNIRKRLWRAIFSAGDDRLRGVDLVAHANRIATTEEKLRIADVSELLADTLRDAGGDQEVDAHGELASDLTRLQLEAQAVEAHALPPRRRRRRVVHRTG